MILSQSARGNLLKVACIIIITVLVILEKSPLISDIELSLFSCSWKEIQRKERELEANIKRPAEADKYKTETLAEANKLVHTLIHT